MRRKCSLPIILGALVFLVVVINLSFLDVSCHYEQLVNFLDCDKPLLLTLRDGSIVRPINISTSYLNWNQLKPDYAKMFGRIRNEQSFLTVGIPTIRRITGADYLMKTLDSLVRESTNQEKSQMVIVVFLADFNETYNNEVVKTIATTYPNEVDSGFIQVVQASRLYYPPLQELKRNFDDAPDRVKWRVKQVLDYTFLFMYSANISEYYLQLEDDVFASRNYFTSIKTFISYHQRKNWAMLEFSELGFIGKLFHSHDLPKLAKFMRTFYQEQPVDWLMRYFRETMAQKQPLLRKPTLFQHFGLKSSFDLSHDNTLKDRFFDSGQKRWRGDDPPARVMSTISAHGDFVEDLSYSSGSGFFWAQKPTAGDTVQVIFEEPQFVKSIYVQTGNVDHPSDILHSGKLEVSSHIIRQSEHSAVCADPVVLGEFVSGQLEVENVTLSEGLECLTITVMQAQANWIIFNQIAVFLRPEQ